MNRLLFILTFLLLEMISQVHVSAQIYGSGNLNSPMVATVDALRLLSTASFKTGIWRSSHSTPGDSPPLYYVPGSGVCATDDGESCVNSSDSNHWSAVFPSSGSGGTFSLTPLQFGAVCDGGTHPLSGYYGSLGAAQAVYPFITSLSQQIDYAALKKMSNTALGPDGSEHGAANPGLNTPMFIGPGTCNLGTDTWIIRNAVGISINGAATGATTLSGSGIVLQFDGLWYSNLSNLGIATTSSSAVVALDIDGNVPGHAYATRSVQANTFTNISVGGGGSTYALALCRGGGGGAQCSENTFINLHGSNAAFAVYYQNGYNALDNMILGGDMQNFALNGIYLFAGSISVYRMSFESQHGYNPTLNGACDINASSGGIGDAIIVHGNRTQDMCFYLGAASQPVDIRGFTQSLENFPWSAATPFALSQITVQIGTDSKSHVYAVTTAGTSAGAHPVWPSGGTVTDGSIVWTEVDYNVIDMYGSPDYPTWYLDASAGWNVRKNNFATGNASFTSSNPYGIYSDGGSAVFENCTHSAGTGFVMCLYGNPQGTSQTLDSGLPFPANSIGIQGTSNGFNLGSAGSISQYIYYDATYFKGPMTLANITVGSKTCDNGIKGAEMYFTDGTAAGWGAPITGSGSGVKGTCNGTNWVAQ